MEKQIFRTSKNHVETWETEDGTKLGQCLGFEGADMIFIHPETGERLVARFGTLKEDGTFLDFCQAMTCSGCEGRKRTVACRKVERYKENEGYYINFDVSAEAAS